MFRKLAKNKKAQNTAEYAILISLVVAGIIAMQTYAQRALQARVRDAAVYLVNQTKFNGTNGTTQYEPYYLESNYNVTRDENESQIYGLKADGKSGLYTQTVNSTNTRTEGGFQRQEYNGFGLENSL
jgi:hypothetical protein